MIVGRPLLATLAILMNGNHGVRRYNFDEHVNKAGEYGYLGACGVTLKEGHGVLGNGSAVAFTTGYGDGLYPVYAEFNDDGRIAKVVIVFEEDEE